MSYKNKNIWIVFVFVAELLLFYSYAVRITEMSYPVAFDQISYMNQSYSLYENIISKNYGEIVDFIVSQPTGFLYQIMGMIMLFLFGNSRVALLFVNLFGFILVQAAGGYMLWKLSESFKCTLIFEGLFLMAKSAFFWAGDLLDFRIDFFASCMYTCWVLLFMCFQKYKIKKYFIANIFTAVILILCRPITIAYVFGVISVSTVILCIVYSKEYKNIIKMAVSYGIAIVVFVTPYLFLIRKSLYAYYGIGHLLGAEKEIRAAEQGVHSLWQNLVFYPKSLIKDHLGVSVFVICCFLIIAGFLVSVLEKQRWKDHMFIKNSVISLCAVLVPICVLTLDQSKSPVVVNIVTASAIVFSVYIFSSIYWNNDGKYKKMFINLIVMLCLLLGACSFVSNVTGEKINYSNVRQAQNDKVEMNKVIAEFVKNSPGSPPSIFMDRIREWLNIGSIQLFAYEDYRFQAELDDALADKGNAEGMGLMQEYDREVIQEALDEADIVITSARDYAAASLYPYDISLEKERSYIYEYCVENLSVLISKEIDGDNIVVFAREKADITGMSSNWLMKEGNHISFRKMEETTSTLIVSGEMSEYSPSGIVSICSAGGTKLPSDMDIDPLNKTYKIIVDISSFPVGAGYFELGFNKAFRPKDLGISDDVNEYTVPFPKELVITEQYLELSSKFSDWMGENENYLKYIDWTNQAHEIVLSGNFYNICPEDLRIICRNYETKADYPVKLQIYDDQYKITISLGSDYKHRQKVQTLELCFNDYYNPYKEGDSEDDRNLTLPVPSLVEWKTAEDNN